MIVSRLRLALLAPGLLAGCTMAPHYARPALSVPAAPPPVDGGQDTPEIAAARSQTVPPLGWESFFTQPQLRQVVALALANNRDLRIAMAHVAQARAQAHVQGAELFPTVNASAGATYQRTLGGLAGSGTTAGVPNGSGSARYDIYQAQVGVSAWEIDLFGRVRSLTQAALEQYLASADNRRAAQVTLVSEVAHGWLQLASDREQLTIARETAATFEQTLKITQGRAAMGVSSDLDLHQAETTWQQANADVARLVTTVAQDRNALDLLAGTHVPEALLAAGQSDQDATIAQLPGGLSSSVLLKRADVSAAEHQLKAANANIGVARAAFFPNISLTAAFGTLSLGLSNLFGNGSQAWTVAPTVSLPIFDAGRNIGNLHDANANRDAMVATYEKAVQTAFREVADALARRATIDAQLGAEQKRAGAAQSALLISRARYQEGVDPFLTTLDSERSAYAARQDLVTTRLEKQTNAVELYRALGGGMAGGEQDAAALKD
jgi:multidrug efflux system outer membrane protein